MAFVLSKDLAVTQVCEKPVVSKKPWEVPETIVLEREHLEVFTACVVTRAQTHAAKKGNFGEHEESGDLADTFFAQLAEVSPCFQSC